MPLPYFVSSDRSAGVICAFVYAVLIRAFALDMLFMHQDIFKLSILANIYIHSSIGHLVECQTRVLLLLDTPPFWREGFYQGLGNAFRNESSRQDSRVLFLFCLFPNK